MRNFSVLEQMFIQNVDGPLHDVLTTAPARRWTRLEDMAQDGHAGAAAIMGARAFDEAINTSPLASWFGVDTQNYEIAYENLSRYRLAGGQVDVSADIARAGEALPEETRLQLDARAVEWAAEHPHAIYAAEEPFVAPVDTTPEAEPVAEANTAEAPAEDASVEAAPAEEAPAEDVVAEAEPTAEAPVEDTPVEETPTEAAPAEEATVEEPATADAEEAVAEASPAEIADNTPAHYLVERGDTLSQLMTEKYGITGWANIQEAYTQIAELSGVDNPDKIYANETVLTLPRELTLSNGQSFPILSNDEPTGDIDFQREVIGNDEAVSSLTNDFGVNAALLDIPQQVIPAIRPSQDLALA